jgi:hypothetical protein
LSCIGGVLSGSVVVGKKEYRAAVGLAQYE